MASAYSFGIFKLLYFSNYYKLNYTVAIFAVVKFNLIKSYCYFSVRDSNVLLRKQKISNHNNAQPSAIESTFNLTISWQETTLKNNKVKDLLSMLVISPSVCKKIYSVTHLKLSVWYIVENQVLMHTIMVANLRSIIDKKWKYCFITTQRNLTSVSWYCYVIGYTTPLQTWN